MSSYATIDDLTRFGLPAAAFSDLSADDVQAALDAASTVADSYLSLRFTVPYQNPGADIKDAVCRIAAFNIMSSRGFNPDGDAGQLRLRYEDAIRWLEKVAREAAQPANIPQGTESLADFGTYSVNQLRGWSGSSSGSGGW